MQINFVSDYAFQLDVSLLRLPWQQIRAYNIFTCYNFTSYGQKSVSCKFPSELHHLQTGNFFQSASKYKTYHFFFISLYQPNLLFYGFVHVYANVCTFTLAEHIVLSV